MWTCYPETHLFKQGKCWLTRSEYLNSTMLLITKALSCQSFLLCRFCGQTEFLEPKYAKPNKSQNATMAFPAIQRTALPHHRQCLLLVIVVGFACALPLCFISSSPFSCICAAGLQSNRLYILRRLRGFTALLSPNLNKTELTEETPFQAQVKSGWDFSEGPLQASAGTGDSWTLFLLQQQQMWDFHDNLGGTLVSKIHEWISQRGPV